MAQELRDRNQYFQSREASKYLREYAGGISYALNRVDQEEMERAAETLKDVVICGGRVFVGGNGGSAAISDHLTCDFIKGTYTERCNAIQTHSLVGSQALFTALANDIGYQYVFSKQLEMAKINSHDCLILISSSGNSPNIIEAAIYAKSKIATVIGLTGFDGGALLKASDIKLHVPYNNYGVVEDCHQAIMHALAQFHYLSTT